MGRQALQSARLADIQGGMAGLVPDLFPDIFPGMFDSGNSSGNPAIVAEDVTGGFKYKDFNGVRYRQGLNDKTDVSLNDITQGQLGDCYFMAALGAIARIKPDWIKGLIKENKEDPKDKAAVTSYSVTFYDSDLDAVTEKITPSFPVTTYGNPAYAQSGDYDSANQSYELWPMIMEKAYAKWYDGYANIESGYVDTALRQLTGKSASMHYRDWSLTWYLGTENEPILDWVTRMNTDFLANKAVCVTTYDKGSKKSNLGKAKNGVEVIGSHVYVVTSIKLDGAKTTVTLYNPHGSDLDPNTQDHPILDLTQFEAYIYRYASLDESLK